MSSLENEDSFFLPQKEGESKEYAKIRDLPAELNPDTRHYEETARECIEYLWKEIKDRGLLDSNFQKEAQESNEKFFQRYWEMHLAVTLLQRGYILEKPRNGGPDFLFMLDGKKVWIEAIAPTSGEGPDAVPIQNLNGVAYDSPKNEICFRLTNALYEKHKQFKKYLKKGSVTKDDICIVAINAYMVREASYGGFATSFPDTAFYGIGNLVLQTDKNTKDITGSHMSHKAETIRQNDSSVSMTMLLEKKYANISGVLYSTASPYHCKPAQGKMGSNFEMLHHLMANNPIPKEVFTWCD